ncbi:MAG: hypothetical protein AAFY55_00315 [Bacteroidota bacterium]
MTDSAPTGSLTDAARWGIRLLVGSVAMLVVIGGGMLVWVVDKAARNPDVRTERPGWLDEAVGFDVSFWIPLALTIGVGGVLVFFVYATAIKRLRAGEDLYAQRHGKGVRRHGERALQTGEEGP